ncbi:unnamed protein product [Aphanomyces euteiches]|uniref:Uncharacterized protein n=1 Tax=Aphanomyces euteiches TaxID=100861 RepID=A0A6G0XDA0_9STRA|nr:hypothetical protein Ae201684_006160 [Aphanomyces euteiches]KAH9068992.1 hypothetical protein Ae201684P_004689 [Aphanomyces euteiches]KAH9134224.1 hypothetical protein AeRB84_019939 [Aphanomyces euteiches]
MKLVQVVLSVCAVASIALGATPKPTTTKAVPTPARLEELKKLGLPANYDSLPNSTKYIPDSVATISQPLNFTRPPCYDEPVVQYPNGSNSSYQCWLSQQPSFDELDSPNDMLTTCKQNNWRPCFYLGNDHIRSPSLGYDYFFRVTGPVAQAVVPLETSVWQGVWVAQGFMALQSYTEQLCLDAFWDNNNLYVHGYTCDPNNPNQWWNFNVNLDTSQSQLIRHGGHPGWCLQTNGLLSASNFNNVQMIPCNGGVLEQQKRLYFGAFGSR